MRPAVWFMHEPDWGIPGGMVSLPNVEEPT